METQNLTIKEAREHLDNGDISAVKLAESFLDVIEHKDKEIHAYLEVFDDVIEQAEAADKIIENGKSTPLTGIPIAIKDNILIEGHIASAASKILENYKATYDATVIEKLRKSGAVFLGRTNMDEFAMGSSTQSSAFGVTRNPHETTRVPGGSSGGSAAAVARGMALGALGSDTAGSIRQPASFCGVVGFKPTYGSVSRSGLIALGSSFDCIGPIARSVSDAELIFNTILGSDKMDSTSVWDGLYGKKEIKKDLTVGVPRIFLEESGLDENVMDNFNESLEKLKSLGYKVKDIVLPNIEYAVPAYYVILPAEASTNLARFDGMKYGLHVDGVDLLDEYLKSRGQGFGYEPRRRIILGTYVLSAGYHDAYYNKANAVRKLISQDFVKAFEDVDVVSMPTSPHVAFKIGEKMDDPVKMYLEDTFTVPANHAGLPAISVPSGFVSPTSQENNKGRGSDRSVEKEDGKKLPLGLQFMAPHMQEHILFEVGKKFEATQNGPVRNGV